MPPQAPTGSLGPGHSLYQACRERGLKARTPGLSLSPAQGLHHLHCTQFIFINELLEVPGVLRSPERVGRACPGLHPGVQGVGPPPGLLCWTSTLPRAQGRGPVHLLTPRLKS